MLTPSTRPRQGLIRERSFVSASGREYIGPYRLLRVILAGRTCVVWEAMHDGDQEKVVIKALGNEHRKDREQLALLKREYTVGKDFSHPYVLHIRQFGTDQGTPYVAMDFFDGPNLKQKLREGVAKIAHRAERIIDQAADGLHYFHEQGWVHRDVKPDNVLVNDRDQLKWIDFAIAQKPKTGLAKLFAMKSKVQGTRSYMSPEQIRGEACDRRADIYGFGCMVFELVGGKVPYTAGSADELLTKHLKAGVPSLAAVEPNVTKEFSDLVARSMAKKPADRPESMKVFRDTLSSLRVFRKQPQPPETPQ